MPNRHMMDIRVVITNSRDRVFQPMREALLIGFEVRPATLELTSGASLLSIFSMRLTQMSMVERTIDCQLSSMIKFVTGPHKQQIIQAKQVAIYF